MPARIVRGLPKRSVSRPETGDSAYMPNVCADSTNPTAAMSWPCSVMCSGVMVMISVITTWPDDERHHGDRDRRPPQQRPRGDARGRTAAVRAPMRSASVVGVGAKAPRGQQRRGAHEDAPARRTRR